VLEVVHTAPLLDKLDVYLPMGIQEVWVFRDGVFSLYALDRTNLAYAPRRGSGLIPGLDFEMLARYALREDTPQALRELEAEIGR